MAERHGERTPEFRAGRSPRDVDILRHERDTTSSTRGFHLFRLLLPQDHRPRAAVGVDCVSPLRDDDALHRSDRAGRRGPPPGEPRAGTSRRREGSARFTARVESGAARDAFVPSYHDRRRTTADRRYECGEEGATRGGGGTLKKEASRDLSKRKRRATSRGKSRSPPALEDGRHGLGKGRPRSAVAGQIAPDDDVGGTPVVRRRRRRRGRGSPPQPRRPEDDAGRAVASDAVKNFGIAVRGEDRRIRRGGRRRRAAAPLRPPRNDEEIRREGPFPSRGPGRGASRRARSVRG